MSVPTTHRHAKSVRCRPALAVERRPASASDFHVPEIGRTGSHRLQTSPPDSIELCSPTWADRTSVPIPGSCRERDRRGDDPYTRYGDRLSLKPRAIVRAIDSSFYGVVRAIYRSSDKFDRRLPTSAPPENWETRARAGVGRARPDGRGAGSGS